MKVSALLEAMPGVGKVRAQQIMERLEIAPSRRLRGLGDRQRKALLADFNGGGPPAPRCGRPVRRPAPPGLGGDKALPRSARGPRRRDLPPLWPPPNPGRGRL